LPTESFDGCCLSDDLAERGEPEIQPPSIHVRVNGGDPLTVTGALELAAAIVERPENAVRAQLTVCPGAGMPAHLKSGESGARDNPSHGPGARLKREAAVEPTHQQAVAKPGP
jgi:hypothetical protein